MHKTQQQGRSLVEMIGVIVLTALMTIAVYEIFTRVVRSARAHALEQEINTRVTQLRHQALTSKGIQPETIEIALSRVVQTSTGLPIQTYSVDAGTFTLRVGYNQAPMDYEVCQMMMDSPSFSPDNTNACQENQDYADFIFPKFSELAKFAQGDDPYADGMIDCGANAYQRGNNCRCNTGYENWIDGVGCSLIVLSCGVNAHPDGTNCVCDEGYGDWIDGVGCSEIERCFETIDSGCKSCSDLSSWRVLSAEDCTSVCPDREVFGTSVQYCRLKQCPSGYFMAVDNGKCLLCSDLGYHRVKDAASCTDPCSNREITGYYGTGTSNPVCSVKECPFGFFERSDSLSRTCIPCDDTQVYDYMTAAGCAMCDETESPRKFETERNECRPICKEGFFDTEDDGCMECSDEYLEYTKTRQECEKCSERKVILYDEKYDDYVCAIKTCPEGQYHDPYGNCISCSYNRADSATKEGCAECDSTDTPRAIYGDAMTDEEFITDTGDSLTYYYCEVCPNGGTCQGGELTCDSGKRAGTDRWGNLACNNCELGAEDCNCPAATPYADGNGGCGCRAGYYKSGNVCVACTGNKEYSGVAATVCSTCEGEQMANVAHTACCPYGSGSGTGEQTDIAGCFCEAVKPFWTEGDSSVRTIKVCSECRSNQDCTNSDTYCGWGEYKCVSQAGCTDYTTPIYCTDKGVLIEITLPSGTKIYSSDQRVIGVTGNENFCLAHGMSTVSKDIFTGQDAMGNGVSLVNSFTSSNSGNRMFQLNDPHRWGSGYSTTLTVWNGNSYLDYSLSTRLAYPLCIPN